MFCNTPEAFVTEWEALSAAQHTVAQGYDQELLPVQWWFIYPLNYLPFEHSENLEHKRKCIKLFRQLSHDPESAGAIKYVFQHNEVIAGFACFPHRNQILGRISTLEEMVFF